MKVESIKIKNFRTIDDDLTIEMDNGLTIVGPNSSGKTNILKAIEMFFTGFENRSQYILARDLPHKQENGQTSLTGTFIIEGNDIEIRDTYNNINNCLEVPKSSTNKINIYLTFTRAGNPVYRLFVGDKHKQEKKDEFNQYQRELLILIIAAFECHYVPSAKSINSLYQELLLPYIKGYISSKLQEKVDDINSGLKEISDIIDKQLENVGLDHIKSHFKIPNDSLNELISTFEYHLSDPVKTEIDRKGMGIQSAAIFAAFTWITQEEHKLGKRAIWLIEEPESYLHPELASSCYAMLKDISEKTHLITSTHSLNFVPQNPKQIIGTKIENGYTKLIKFSTFTEATNTIRSSLGVKFSDFCNLGVLNIFVEGKSDREVFEWVLSKIAIKPTGMYAWDNVRSASFLDFGGTTALEGFLKATYEYIHKERPSVIILDGDDAGDKTRRNLQSFFGKKKINFVSNEHFVILPKGFSLEGLFPHSWIKDAYLEHKNWFENYSLDMNDSLLPFTLKNETTKDQLREYLKRKAEVQENEDWANNFISLFEIIEATLEKQSLHLYKEIDNKSADVDTTKTTSNLHASELAIA